MKKRFVRTVLNYLQQPSEKNKHQLAEAAKELDMIYIFSERIPVSENLDEIINKLQNNDWNAWRNLYLESEDPDTMSIVEIVCPWRNPQFESNHKIKDYLSNKKNIAA
ncbi:hypothetical protein J4456_03340 [Candidatus Pacearchaeota archaeon]|nr:hypothetical protein [Candidatus Pacearchaeota archaeon]